MELLHVTVLISWRFEYSDHLRASITLRFDSYLHLYESIGILAIRLRSLTFESQIRCFQSAIYGDVLLLEVKNLQMIIIRASDVDGFRVVTVEKFCWHSHDALT